MSRFPVFEFHFRVNYYYRQALFCGFMKISINHCEWLLWFAKDSILLQTFLRKLCRICIAVRKDAHYNITLIGHSLTTRLPENSISQALTSFEGQKIVWNFPNQRERPKLSATSNRSPRTTRNSSTSKHVISGKKFLNIKQTWSDPRELSHNRRRNNPFYLWPMSQDKWVRLALGN